MTKNIDPKAKLAPKILRINMLLFIICGKMPLQQTGSIPVLWALKTPTKKPHSLRNSCFSMKMHHYSPAKIPLLQVTRPACENVILHPRKSWQLVQNGIALFDGFKWNSVIERIGRRYWASRKIFAIRIFSAIQVIETPASPVRLSTAIRDHDSIAPNSRSSSNSTCM